jgi:hypothetical protein
MEKSERHLLDGMKFCTHKHTNSTNDGNFRDGNRNTVKTLVTEGCTTHKGYVDLSIQIANTYRISGRTWRQIKKTSFHPKCPTYLQSCGGNITNI